MCPLGIKTVKTVRTVAIPGVANLVLLPLNLTTGSPFNILVLYVGLLASVACTAWLELPEESSHCATLSSSLSPVIASASK